MKEYPSISKNIRSDIDVFCFDKLDGSCIRSEWSKKRGFYKFGTKKCMLGEDHEVFGESIGLIRQKYEEDLAKTFLQQKWDNVTCFFEFGGSNSFSGHHDLTEPHDVVLFDVNVYKQGLLNPSDFIDLFQEFGIPKVLYYGKANSLFVEQVISSNLENMTFEGVVCKGKNDKKTKMPIMFKIKSKAWLDKLKTFCKNDDKLFQQLV